MRRPPFALLSVVAVLGAGLWAGHATELKPAGAATTANAAVRETRPVDGAIGVCPELIREGSDVVTRLTAGVATPGDVTVRAATLEPGTGLGPVVLHTGARVGALNLRTDSAVAAVVTASGPQSGGLEVEQVSRGADGPHRGWAGLRCEAPVADSWFLGAVTSTGNDSQLVLVNPYDDRALVRVELYGARGAIDVPELEGVVLPPRGRVVRELARIAPDEHQLAVHVVAREGRVAPAIRVSRAKGSTPLGVDWLPRLTEPGTQVDIPGTPEGNGARRLYVFVPGEDTAHVTVQFTLPDEQFVPDGFDEIDVPAGRPVSIDLAKVLTVVNQRTAEKTLRATALRIHAEGAPVFVTAFAESHARFLPIKEIGYVGPAGPLTGPTLVTEARNTEDFDCALLLSAPDGRARVTIHTMVKEGHTPRPIVSKTLDVPQGRLVVFPYRRLERDPLASVVITPADDSAPVYVTRVISERGARGPLFSATALVTQPAAGFQVPEVTADPSAALPNLDRSE